MPRHAYPKSDGLLSAALACLLAGVGGWLRLHLPLLPPEGPGLFDGVRGNASDLSWLMLAMATAIAFQAAAGRMAAAPALRRNLERLALALLVIGTLAVFAGYCWHRKSGTVGGARYFWLDDDMMISMRFARNFAEGRGLVWNPGGLPVEGYSNFLWTLTMIPAHLVLPPRLAAAFVLAIEAGLLAAILFLVWRLGAALGLKPGERLLAAAILAINQWFFYWTAGGSEAPLEACLILLGALAILRAGRSRPLGWGAGILLGLLGTVRADAPLIGGLFLLMWLALIPSRRAGRAAWLPIVLLPLGVMVWQRAYYGDWFPNTYYLRMTGTPERGAIGSHYLLLFLTDAGGLVALVLLHAAIGRARRGRWLAAIPFAILLYGVYVGGDELPEFRFYAPAVPLLIVLAVAGASRALGLAARRCSPALRLNMSMTALAFAGFFTLLMPYHLGKLGTERSKAEQQNVQIGVLLNLHTRPGAVIAHSWAGAAPYFSNRTALDMLGKVDPHIARLTAIPGDMMPAHNKYDAAYIYDQKPDIVVAGINAGTVQDPKAFQSTPVRDTYPGILRSLEDPVFARDYLPNAAPIPISMDYHGIFIRAGSTLADPPEAWVVKP